MQADDAYDIAIMIPLYNLTECRDSYSKTYETSWQYYRHKPALVAHAIIDFTVANAITDWVKTSK